MAVTLAIHFPLGRYHATAWDRNVNEGAVEWPPSPWRILRALVATWYTRWPELPATDLDDLLDALGSPPTYHTPPARAGHSRHYLPDSDRNTGESGHTDLALDPFLSLPRDQPLLVRWDTELTAAQRTILGKLAELIPHLGRADSICEARLIDEESTPDGRWWAPATDGDTAAVRLLASAQPVRRAALEVSTTEVRKARRTVPEHTRWIPYRAPVPTIHSGSARQSPSITAARYAVRCAAPMRATHAVLLADLLHEAAAYLLPSHDADGIAGSIFGRNGETTHHRHAHWTPLPDANGTITSVVIWVDNGLSTQILGKLLGPIHLDGRRGDYEIKGMPQVTLLLEGIGDIQLVAPELCGPASTWISATPYLPVRHRKRRDAPDGFLHADVQRELEYRAKPTGVDVARCEPGDGVMDRWGRSFRRYRATEHLGRARPGLGLRLRFDEPVPGPLLLGQLSHFGFGQFRPLLQE